MNIELILMRMWAASNKSESGQLSSNLTKKLDMKLYFFIVSLAHVANS